MPFILHSTPPMCRTMIPVFSALEYYERKADIEKFNEQNRWRKKGIAVSIMNFPVAYFFSTSVYVAIHHGDGTVSVSHGGSEVGQGTCTNARSDITHA